MSITRLARLVEIPLLERCGYRAVRQRGGLVEMEPVPAIVKPLAIDLFCGLGGWTEGLLAEGWDVIGFDNVRHEYGEHKYPSKLVIQDVLTLHGSQFKNAALIVASPPCQEYSYMAMPWSLAKAKAAAIHADKSGAALEKLNRLFNSCFRIQREASAAAGRNIPLIVENVRGAQPWVGHARWAFGSFMLWGDVPALMPITFKAIKVPTMGAGWYPPDHPKHVKGLGFNTHADRNLREDIKNAGGSWFGSYADQKAQGTISSGRLHGKGSPKRAMASAMIAKIPLPLSRYIARTFKPDDLCTKRKEPAEAERLAFEVMADWMGPNV